MKMHNPSLGALWMICAAFSFAVINSLVQYLSINYNIASTTIALLQYSFALVFIFPWLMKLGIKASLRTNNLKLHLLRVLFAVIGLQLWLWALAYPIPIWQGISLLMLSPIFSTIGAAIFLKEFVSLARWFATLLGFIGASLILEPWSDHFYLATCLPIGAAFFWSCSSMIVKKLSKSEKTTTLIVYLLLLTAPFNVFIAFSNWSLPLGSSTWLFLALSGLLTSLAQYALIRAYTVADASFVQPFDNIKLPLNILASFIVFGTMPPGRLWLGAAFIIISVIFITHNEKIKRSKAK
jgi:drug/metabolite transporter (DMT)-like permease